jgi:hypothetical protein
LGVIKDGKIVTEGSFILFSSADYEYPNTGPLCVASVEFDIKKIYQEYLSEFPDEKYDGIDTVDSHFYKWITEEKKLLRRINCVEICMTQEDDKLRLDIDDGI